MIGLSSPSSERVVLTAMSSHTAPSDGDRCPRMASRHSGLHWQSPSRGGVVCGDDNRSCRLTSGRHAFNGRWVDVDA